MRSVDNTMKPDYGLDAPTVVRNFILLSLLSFLLTIATFLIQSPVWFWLAFSYAFFYTVLFLIFAFWMYYSSRFTKPKIARDLIDWFNLKGDEKILDLGCGRGLFLIAAAKRLTHGKAVGIDLWRSVDQSGNCPEMLLRNAQLEGLEEKIEIHTGDIQKLPFPDAFFDTVFSSLVIHNIPTAEGRHCALQELLRVLKPGGRFAILDIRYTLKYANILAQLGVADIQRKKTKYFYFPPLRVVTGSNTKPNK